MPKVKERINEMARTMCDCYHDGKCSAHHNAGCALIGSVDCISKQKALSLLHAGYIHISDSKNIVKQAKIDVLNKAKERCDLVAEELEEDEIDHYGSSAAYSCTYEIKKIIAEVQNG